MTAPQDSADAQSTALATLDTPTQAIGTRAPRTTTLLRPVALPAAIIQAQQETVAFIASVLKKGRDYGTIPGTKTPTLLKPGSEKVLIGFGCVARPIILSSVEKHDEVVQWEKRKKGWNGAPDQHTTGESVGLYSYTVKVEIVKQDTGEIVGEGIGVCSTLEAKYVDRPRECQNTALKMATKRAQVDATLRTFGLSDEFTQDLDDIIPIVELNAVNDAQRMLTTLLTALPGWAKNQREWWREKVTAAGNDGEAMQRVIEKLVAEVEKRGFLTGAPEAKADAPKLDTPKAVEQAQDDADADDEDADETRAQAEKAEEADGTPGGWRKHLVPPAGKA